MNKEKYNLVCKGELVQGAEKSSVIPEIIKLFNTDEGTALKILENTAKVILRNAEWEKVVSYHIALKKIGLVSQVSLVMDAEIFRDSLLETSIETDDKTFNPESKNKDTVATGEKTLQRFKLNVSGLIPSIFSKPHSEDIVDQDGNSKFYLESHNHFISPKFLLVISMFFALFIQRYSGLLLVQYAGDQVVITLSILLFSSVIFFLPKAMSPARIISLHDATDGAAYLLCEQVGSLNPFKNYYKIYSADDTLLATVEEKKLKNNIMCFDAGGNVLYSSAGEEGVHADDVTKDIAGEMRDNIFDFSIFEYVRFFTVNIKKIKFWLNNEEQTYERGNAYVVRDGNKKKIAYFYPGKESEMELPSLENSKPEYKSLVAFLLVCLGVS